MENIDKYKFLEPSNLNSAESKLERIWRQISGAFSIISVRTQQFSPLANMTYSPVEYVFEEFNIGNSAMPSAEWIQENFISFVNGEMNTLEFHKLAQDWQPNLSKDQLEISDINFHEIMLKSESVEDYRSENLQTNNSSEIAARIFEILCHPRFGTAKNKENNSLDEFVERIKPFIEAQERLLFICPGFPFKDQNRFRVSFDGFYPDMAEVAFMMRVNRIIEAIFQVHAYGGADMLILSDGDLYKDIFGISDETINRYMQNLYYYRNKLNVQGTVSIISLKELIERANNSGAITKIKNHIKTCLSQLIISNCAEPFKILKQGMKWNYNTRTNDFFQSISDKDCWMIIRGDIADIPPKLKNKWEKFDQIATNSALEYAAVNLMLKHTDLIKKFFPHSIRATIHPKKNQFALNDSKSYAWNGVAYSKKWPTSTDDIDTVPYMELTKKASPLRMVVFEHSNFPAFFTSGSRYTNIEKARSILPAHGWKLKCSQGIITGREFTNEDYAAIIGLALNDKNFIWERVQVQNSYFSSLLEFRINHYKKYGFGVHGIWMNGGLIGQCGLQVASADKDKVEFVIFLGKNFTQQGIGKALTQFIVDKCKNAGMSELEGIVRVDNTEGQKLLEKFGEKTNDMVTHYRHPAIVYKLI